MPETMPALDNLTLSITQELHIQAPLEAAFDAILEQMGPGNETPDGKPLSMKLEAWPGGRWFRDLGNQDGHLWGHVQAIKRPTLVEITGPLFMSAAVLSNVQYRLAPDTVRGGTIIAFRHTALGLVSNEFRDGMVRGWTPLFERIRRQAEIKIQENHTR